MLNIAEFSNDPKVIEWIFSDSNGLKSEKGDVRDFAATILE